MSTAIGSTQGNGAGSGELRIILVGRTGLDSGLRREPGVELVRTRTAIEAIGEVADPIDGESPKAAAVVVGPDADPGDDAGRFVSAVRLADPAAKVLLVENGAPAASRGAYDGVLAPNAGATMIRSLVLGAPRPAQPVVVGPQAAAPAGVISLPRSGEGRTIEPTPAAVAAAAVEPPVTARPVELAPVQPPMVAGSATDDLALVQAALAGRDLVLPALEVIRRRTGWADVIMAPAGTPGAGVAVAHHGKVYGHLLCGSAAGGAGLEPHAQWLGAWLAVRDQQEALKRAALHDDLTGAYNRRYFEGFLREAIEKAKRERATVTIMVFDVDDFKRFNDDHGHAAGDEILQQTVALLKSVIREGDRVCRIGGDEFVVIFHEAGGPREPGSKPPTDVCQIAARFQKQIAAHRFPKLGEHAPGRLSISGGLATFPWDGRTPAELLECADRLALESKRAGKNCLTIGPGTQREFPA